MEVLVEEKSDVNGKEMWTGHTKEYMKIALESEKKSSELYSKRAN